MGLPDWIRERERETLSEPQPPFSPSVRPAIHESQQLPSRQVSCLLPTYPSNYLSFCVSISELPKMVPACASVMCFLHFDFTPACTFSASQPPNAVPAWCAFHILTSTCASPHSPVHFFDSSTSKSAPTLRCFWPFDFEICFAPQWRAIVHLSFPQMAPNPPL